MRKTSTFLIPALIGAVFLVAATDADAARKKKWRKVLFCQGDHLHYGASESFKSKRSAMRDAIESWRSFTVFEYGSEWGNWRISVNKSVKCTRSNKLWQCNIQSTPCRKRRRGEK